MKKLINVLLIALVFTSCSSTSTKDKNKASIYYSHGTQKLIEKDYTKALSLLLRAYEINKDTDICTNLGMAYYLKKDIVNAKKMFGEAIDLDEKNADARNNLASILVEENKYNEAREQYEIIMGDLTYSKQYRINYNLGVIEFRLGNREAAIEYLTKASAEKQDYCAANNLLGEVYYDVKDFNSALDWFKKATMGECFKQVIPHFNIGKTLMELGQLDRATQKFIDLKERFSKTKFSSLADIELKKIRNLRSRREIGRKFENNENGNFQTPSF